MTEPTIEDAIEGLKHPLTLQEMESAFAGRIFRTKNTRDEPRTRRTLAFLRGIPAIIAAYEELKPLAAANKVIKLEWHPDRLTNGKWANTPFGRYHAWSFCGYGRFSFNDRRHEDPVGTTLEEAIAGAEADFAERIRLCMAPATEERS